MRQLPHKDDGAGPFRDYNQHVSSATLSKVDTSRHCFASFIQSLQGIDALQDTEVPKCSQQKDLTWFQMGLVDFFDKSFSTE